MPFNKSKSRSQFSGKEKKGFKIYVKVEATEEVFPLKNIHNDMKISELKDYLEFATGLPVNLQRISYLDQGDLLAHTDIRSNDIVPGGTILLKVWPEYRELLEAAASNDEEWVFNLGVTYPSDFKTPNSEYMSRNARRQYFTERAFVALCIAAHRGHKHLCEKLIDSGANLNFTSPLGRTALHIAAAKGHGHIIDLLLMKGANINAEDISGKSALHNADNFGNKKCERHLFLFRWQQRAKNLRPSKEPPLMPHQYFDSQFRIWLQGEQCQMYLTNVAPLNEFEGTAINSPRKRPHPGVIRRNQFKETETVHDGEDIHERHTSDGSLPPIKSKQIHNLFHSAPGKAGRGDGTVGSKPSSHDAWLKRIHDKEKKDRERKRKEKMFKKQEEDHNSTTSDSENEDSDGKRLEEDKAGNYESWLAQKEADRKKGSPLRDEGTILDERIPREEKPEGALKVYLRSLGKDRTGLPYLDWLTNKENERLGTPKTTQALLI